MHQTRTGIVILAAGSSSRLGRPKQLLIYQGKPLIKRVTDAALSARLWPVVVVTGAHAGQVALTIDEQKVTIVYNEHWHTGMASGIVAGVSKILSLSPSIQHLIISACDQPFVTAALFRRIKDQQALTGKGIIACSYAGTKGAPVLFGRKYFNMLTRLKGDEGAKKILLSNEDDVALVDFARGNIDIDTEENYKDLINK